MRSLYLSAFVISVSLVGGATAQDGNGGILPEQQGQQVLSDTYLGSSVFAGRGENMESVGEISALILNENDEVVGAVVDVGGFLGIGAKPVGIDWDLLSSETVADTTVFTTSMSREDFEQAPEYKDKAAKRAEQQSQEQEMESEQDSGQTTGTTY